MKTCSLIELERRAYRSTFQDGIWDIFLGSSLLILAISALLSNIGVSQAVQMTVLVGMETLTVMAFISGKKHITVPRMGFVQFGPVRRRKMKKSYIVLLGSVITALVVFLVALQVVQGHPASRAELLLFAPVAWVANSVIVFTLLAYYLDCSRLYTYGVLFALPVPLDMAIKQFAGINLSPIAFALPAIVMLVVGTVLLVRFLHQYPRLSEEFMNGRP